MDITRRGAERDRGITTIVSGLSLKANAEKRWDENVSWDPAKKQVEIYLRRVRYTDGTTHHNYTIRLTLDDVSALIGLLGHAGSASDAKLLRDHLSKHIPAIVKLLACAAGVAPIPMESEDATNKLAS